MKVEPTHSGMRTSDQFINEWPMMPDTAIMTRRSPRFLGDGIDMSWPKAKPSGVQMIAVQSDVPAVNSVGDMSFFDCFDAMK